MLAPTRRQVQRVRRVLAGRFGGLLGVEVLTHLTLARRAVEAGADRVPALAGRPLREAITERLLNARGGNLADYADRFPPVVGILTGLLGELREAGVTAEALRGEASPGDEKELADLLADTERALDTLLTADPPTTDRAGLTRLAVRALPGMRPYDEVFQVGAYDLVGMNLDLVRAVPSREGVTWLVPADPEAPSWKFARDFLAEFVDAAPEPLDDGGEVRPFVAAARAFRRHLGEPPGPLPEGAVELIHAQGPEAELTLAARAVLRDLGNGYAPDEVGIVARTLEPYAAVAQSVFDRHGLQVDSSLGFPLSREPRAQTFLTLVRALVDDFLRQDVIDLTRAGAAVRPKDGNWAPNQWDRLSRRYRIAGGRDAWIRQLPDLVAGEPPRAGIAGDEERHNAFLAGREKRVESVRQLAAYVADLAAAADAWPREGTGAEHADALAAIGARWIEDWTRDDEVGKRLREALDGLRSLDAAAAAAASVTGRATAASLTRAEAREFLERALTETELRWTPGGIPFLDVMQARGLPFRRLHFLGFNADLVPRRPREDVFLSDATRERVRRVTRRPLTVRRPGLEEEHLLHAQTAASVGEHLALSWQRADAEGKSMAVSLALSEWTRLLPGGLTHRERLGRDGGLGGPWRVPTHPTMNARALGDRFGLLTPLEAVLIIAEEAKSDVPGKVLAFATACTDLDPEVLRPGLALVSAVEDFVQGDPRFDALLDGEAGWRDGFSPSSLERLAGCPQQFFFRYRLGIKALEETSEEHQVDPLDMGLRIHQVLERTYRDLIGKTGEAAAERLAFARTRLAEEWETTFAPLRDRMSRRYPGLWSALEAAWLEELAAFLEKDLDQLARGHLVVKEVEPTFTGEISVRLPDDTAEPVTFLLEGRLDRLARGEGRVVVSDYKTGGNLETWVEPAKVLPGRKLQLPLYTRLARHRYEADSVEAELIGLGPSFFPAKGYVRRGAVRLERLEELEPGLDETLAILVDNARRGLYPMNPEKGPCDYCEFRIACRRHHHPSRERIQAIDALETFFLVQEKSARKMTVDEVRRQQS